MTKYEEEQQEAECQRLQIIRRDIEEERHDLSKNLLPNVSKEIKQLKIEKDKQVKELNLQRKKLKNEFKLKCKQLRKDRNNLRKTIPDFVENKNKLDEIDEQIREAYKKLNEIRRKNYQNENLIERGQENAN